MRTDIHRPSEIDPANYEYITSIDTDLSSLALLCSIMGNMAPVEEMQEIINKYSDLNRNSKTAAYNGTINKCDHCGANLRYVHIYRHSNGDYISVGEDCANNTMEVPNRAMLQMKRIREAAKSRSERANSRRAAEKEFPEAVKILDNFNNGELGYSNDFIYDVASRFRNTNRITKGQAEAIVNSHNRQLEWAAKKEEEKKNLSPVIEGKIQITGKVVSTKTVDSHYGTQYKMLVKDDRGFKVWGSVPKALQSIDIADYQRLVDSGERVQFQATVQKSDRDETFGFFSRPTKAKLLEA